MTDHDVEEQATKDQAQKDMASVTGYFDESQDLSQDLSKVWIFSTDSKAYNSIFEANQQQKLTKAMEQQALQEIVLNKNDVEFIMSELELTKVEAESLLRLNKGQLRDALKAYLIH
jgi:hypothetical protein